MTPAQIQPLTSSQRRELIELARSALWAHFRGRPLDEVIGRCSVKRMGSAFVTLKNKSELRGCCGKLRADLSLAMTVADSAVAAATRDRRFAPVTVEELPQLEIVISVLGPFHRIEKPSQIEIGKHGLYVTRGGAAGLLLPQVAVELQADAETFFALVCQKATLPPDAWRQGASIESFTADVFSSADL